MQRPASSWRDHDEHCIINIKQLEQAKHSPRRRIEDLKEGVLSGRGPRSDAAGDVKRATSVLRPSARWIHCVPVIVLLCMLILWLWSYPAVNLVIKDGRIQAVHRLEILQPFNNTPFDLAILGLATPPIGPVDFQNLTLYDEIEARLVSRPGPDHSAFISSPD